MQVTHNLAISFPGVISSQAEQDDTQLVKASQQGNQDAFALLVQRHQHRSMYRKVLILRQLQDMTYKEMADVLAMPVGTIKARLFRARHLLKERLLAQYLFLPES